MRLPVALLSVVAIPASVLAAPVVTVPEPAPRAVAPKVQELELPAEPQADDGVTAAGPADTVTLVDGDPQRTRPFTTLGVTWEADPGTGEVLVEVRTRSDGTWTDWVPLEAEGLDVLTGTRDAGSPDVRAGTEPLYAGPSDGVQVRVDVAGGGEHPRDVRVSLIDPGTSSADGAPTASVPASTADAAASVPVIRSRAQWGADETIRGGSPSYAGTISAVTLHHTASSNDYSAADVPRLLRGFYAYHVKSLGWSDIGYNVLVDKFGTAWEGRAGGLDRAVIGAHAGGFNTGTAGVSMIGTYGTAEPSAAMKETVASYTAWKLGLHDRDPRGTVSLTSAGSTRYASGTAVTLSRVFGHRDVSATACPGDRGQASLRWLRERAAALQSAGPSSTGPSAPEPTSTPKPAPTPTPTPTPQPPAKPFGTLDSVRPLTAAVQVAGWVIDPDAPEHTRVEVRVDGVRASTVVADRHRPDLVSSFPQYTPDHGFDTTLDVPPGRREVCLTALDQPGTDHLAMGCRSVDVPSGDPIGRLESARTTGDVVGLRLAGWALDPDAGASSTVTFTVDGAVVRTALADQPRPDVAAAHAGATPQRGYDVIVPAAPGQRRICAVAANQGRGADASLGCLDVVVPQRPAAATPPGSRSGAQSCPSGSVPRAAFGDTSASVHRGAVDCAVWWGLTTGVTPSAYRPGQGVTRGQVATFLARTLAAAGTALPASPPDAFDDDRGSPHEHAINQMAAVGVVAGRGARRYDPAGPVTREQMASYLVRAYETHVGAPLPDGGNWFSDDDGSVHQANIGRAARAGFTGGTAPGRFAPAARTDRGQMASFLTRVLDMMVEHGRAPRRG